MKSEDMPALEARLGNIEKMLSTILERNAGVIDWGQIPIPDPSDPAPEDFVRTRVRELVLKNPGWFTDPPPEDFLNVRVIDLIRRYRGGFTDPAPDDLGSVRLRDLITRIPGGGISDPSPEDIGRLTTIELENQIHKINTEVVRLNSLQRMFTERLQELQKR